MQGLTEFFPVSSSAHLELLPWLFGWEHFGGDAEREQAFDVALHVGTLIGAAYFLRHEIVRYYKAAIFDGTMQGLRALRQLVARQRTRPDKPNGNPSTSKDSTDPNCLSRDALVGVALVVSLIPAAIVGVVLESALVSLGEVILVIAVALLVGGWLLWWADRFASQRETEQQAERQTGNFGMRDAIYLGLAQACALIPGVSRSGATITVGRLLRFSRTEAARISFLMSLPIIAGAGAFRGLGLIGDDIPADDLAAMGVGLVTAALTAWLALWGMMRLLAPRSPRPVRSPKPGQPAKHPRIGHQLFTNAALYRSALAILVAVVFLAGWR